MTSAPARASGRGWATPVSAFRHAGDIARLPQTRPGTMLCNMVRKVVDGDAWAVPATVDDPAIFGEIEAAVAGRLGGERT